MNISRILAFAALALPVLLTGCEPAGLGAQDEEKDPLFVEAKSRSAAGDVPGAIQLFERTLLANPGNAAAHLELGLLSERPQNDFASAIYHFQKFLQLRPASDRAEIVKEHMLACKQELAKTVLPASLPQTAERELMNLNRRNDELRRELESLRVQYSNVVVALSNQLSRTPPGAVGGSRMAPGDPRMGPQRGSPPQTGSGDIQPQTRRHTIAKGDTLSSISRRYAVSLESLKAANPGVNERRLQVGQALLIPSR